MKKVLLCAAILGVAATYVQPAFADAEAAITARRAYYQVVKFNSGPLFGMAKGDVDYDAAKAQMYADNLKALSSLNNGPMWIAGSDNEAMKGKTRALKAIWAEGSKIGDAAKAFNVAVDKLAADAGKGVDALRPAVAALGASCSGCHKAYRASDF
ncbi:MAG: cytochrome c [Pseudomonadota bacterium]